ncbi:SAV_2336 N-terminal domain-related protein [Streptomyces sp. NPDC059816]|uniref:SAV_2336 N-terminal domain-related protein n=1 Tax=Streptomyces sp. NPDC059816 TaxID=3346960 RepID=UPI0036671AE5
MGSDRAGPARAPAAVAVGGPVARLAAVLTAAGSGTAPTATELAELLWLAHHARAQGTPPAPAPVTPARPRTPLHLPEPDRPPAPADDPPEPADRTPDPAPPLPDPRPASDAPAAPVTRTPLRAAAPPMLPRPLALQRALRPLGRRVDAPRGHVLDEGATADRTARLARLADTPWWWLPVLRPTRERWLRLHLLHDAGPTMPVWRPLVRELRTALARSGVFRTVEAYRLGADGRVSGPGGAPVPVPVDGRTVTLLVSDCTGPQWWAGAAGARWYGTLWRWTRRMPVAVLQPLPERLWRSTALSPAAGLLSAPGPAAPNAALTFTPYESTDAADPTAPPTTLLPVLEAAPRWLAHWSALIADPGGGRMPGAAARVTYRARPDAPGAPARDDTAALPPDELVARFRATASPEAFRLAGHLTLGTPRLPVMRLVHAALEHDPRPQHLAEVILSGMLTGGGPPEEYAFRPGVREVLLRSLPRSSRVRTRALLARVGALIDERAGTTTGAFGAEALVSGGAGAEPGTAPREDPIATVDLATLRYATRPPAEAEPAPGLFRGGEVLDDRYRLTRPLQPGASLWLARDRRDGQDVVVQPQPPGVTDTNLTHTARRLREIDHPCIVRVLDSGTHGSTGYLVMEHLDGIPLGALAAPSGFLLPSRLTASLARGLAAALSELGERGVVHGAVGMYSVMVMPDGTPKLTSFALGTGPGTDRRGDDLRRFAALLALLMSPDGGSEPRADFLTRLPTTVRTTMAGAITALREGQDAERHAVLVWLADLGTYSLTPPSEQSLQYTLLAAVSVRRTATRSWLDRTDSPGETLALDVPEQIAMLGMLLLRHGRRVSHEQLVQGMWRSGTRPPNPRAVLAGHAAELRRLLGPGRLATLPDGYALHTSADTADVHDFERLAAEADRLWAGGDAIRANRAARTALDLWHGTPLVGVRGPAADQARTRLTALWLRLIEVRTESDLALDRAEVAVRDLDRVIAANPDHPVVLRLRLTALDHAGRTDEARETYRALLDTGERPDPAFERYYGERDRAQGRERDWEQERPPH